jgi:hypothetical protein
MNCDCINTILHSSRRYLLQKHPTIFVVNMVTKYTKMADLHRHPETHHRGGHRAPSTPVELRFGTSSDDASFDVLVLGGSHGPRTLTTHVDFV